MRENTFTVATLFVERRSITNLFGLMSRFSMLDIGYVKAENAESAISIRKKFLSGSFYHFPVKGVYIANQCASEIPATLWL